MVEVVEGAETIVVVEVVGTIEVVEVVEAIEAADAGGATSPAAKVAATAPNPTRASHPTCTPPIRRSGLGGRPQHNQVECPRHLTHKATSTRSARLPRSVRVIDPWAGHPCAQGPA